MKQLKYIVLILCLVGCREADEYLFSDVGRIQLEDTSALTYSFVYVPSEKIRDTIKIPVNVIGGPQDRLRKLCLSQITEYDVFYVKDEHGNVTDSIRTEVINRAIPGVHYVDFQDTEMEKLLCVEPNEIKTDIPVILLRDTSLKTHEVRLGLKLEISADFQLGESIYLKRTIVISDLLAKPSKWNFLCDLFLGKYSKVRHQFMIDVLKMPVDDTWLSRGWGEILYMRDKCSRALEIFNRDPDKLASGKAPLREDPDNPNSPLIKFPTVY